MIDIKLTLKSPFARIVAISICVVNLLLQIPVMAKEVKINLRSTEVNARGFGILVHGNGENSERSDCYLIAPKHLLDLPGGNLASDVIISDRHSTRGTANQTIFATRKYIDETNDFFIGSIDQSENDSLNLRKIDDCSNITPADATIIQGGLRASCLANNCPTFAVYVNGSLQKVQAVGENLLTGVFEFTFEKDEQKLVGGDSGSIVYEISTEGGVRRPYAMYLGADVCEQYEPENPCFYRAIVFRDLLRHARSKSAGPEKSRSKSFVREVFRIEPADTKITREFQREFNRLGCNAGSVDGIWGKKSFSAYLDFSDSIQRNAIQMLELDDEMLEQMRKIDEKICGPACAANERRIGGECTKITCPTGLVLFSDGQCKVPEPPRQQNPVVSRQNPAPQSSSGCVSFEGVEYCP